MKKARGFTLVEIVIVIGIIGLLMVVLVPDIVSSFENNKMKAAKLQAERVAKNIKIAIMSGDIKYEDSEEYYGEVGIDTGNNKITRHLLNKVCWIGGIGTLYKIDSTTKTNKDLIDPTSKAATDEEKTFCVSIWLLNEDAIHIRTADGKTLLHSEPLE